MPSPSQAMSKPSFARFISARWPWNSSQVSWIVRSGAPESSNCPPGSSVMLAPLSCASAIGWPASSTGSQPGSRVGDPRSSAPIPRGPSWGTGRQVPA